MRVILHVLIIRPLLYLMFGVNVVGRENLQNVDKFILFSNHNSHLDVLLLFLILPPGKIDKTHPIAALDYFKKPAWLFGVVNFLFQPIWLDRKTGGISPFKEIRKRLAEGHSIIIFPEGTRGEAGELNNFQQGIGLIEKNNPDTPVIPVYLEGPERAFPKKASFPLPLWNHITIGPPQILRGDSKDITNQLHHHLKTLADEEQAYRQHRISGQSKKPFTIAVIGIDGSGKSTLSRRLIHCFGGESCFISDGLELHTDGEPHDVQPLMVNELRQWIGRKSKKAKNLARYKIPKLAELLLRDHLCSEVERWYRPDYIFMDGSPLLNMTAWAILFHEDFFNPEVCSKAVDVLTGNAEISKDDIIFKQFPELLALKKLHLNRLNIPDVIVFLDVDPEVSIKRIMSRGESIQAHENLEKLTKLRNAYHMVCDVLEKAYPVCRLQGENGLDMLTQEAKTFIENVRRDDH
ncbi:1-acyl-sn-glycerol-3-phosphate acyltransferase [Candidatus Latescibacterota bacterium]